MEVGQGDEHDDEHGDEGHGDVSVELAQEDLLNLPTGIDHAVGEACARQACSFQDFVQGVLGGYSIEKFQLEIWLETHLSLA